LITWTGSANRLLKPTIQNPSASRATSAMRSALSSVCASGFSKRTSRPADSADVAYSSWNRFGVVTNTASQSS